MGEILAAKLMERGERHNIHQSGEDSARLRLPLVTSREPNRLVEEMIAEEMSVEEMSAWEDSTPLLRVSRPLCPRTLAVII